MTARGAKQRPWTAAEIDQIVGGATALPGRNNSAVKGKRLRLGLRVGPAGPWGRMRAWTEIEDEKLRAGAVALPNRTYGAVWYRRKQLGLTSARALAWSEDEIALLRAGARAVGSRSAHAMARKRVQVGAKLVRASAPWTAEEVSALDAGLPIPTRTAEAIQRAHATRVGLAARPVAGVPVKRLPKRSTSPAEQMLADIRAATPFGLGSEIREEVIADAILHVLENGGTAAEAVKLVLPSVRRRTNALQRGKNIDDCFWL